MRPPLLADEPATTAGAVLLPQIDAIPDAAAPEGCGTLCATSWVWAEGLVVSRDNSSSDAGLVLDLNTNEVQLTAGDLDFDWSGGFRLLYGFRNCAGWGWEIGYMGIHEQTAESEIQLEDSLRLPGALGLVVDNFFCADEVGVDYSWDLKGFEVDAVGDCHDVSWSRGLSYEWLLGFRFLDLDEEIGITAFDSAASTTEYRVEVANHLYGMQTGSRVRGCRSRWSWEATGKVGLYGNDMEQNQGPIIDVGNFEFRRHRQSEDSAEAFVGDLNFTGVYQLSRVWGLRVGYNIICIEGVALAPEQLDFSNGLSSGTRLKSGDGVFLHGANVGFEGRW
jgi:hypothetical protein